MRFLPLMCLLGLLGLAPGLLPRSAIAAEQVVSLRVHQGAEPQINTLITTLPTHHQSLSDGQGLWHSSALSAAGDHRFVFNAALSKGVEHLWPVDGHITGPRLPPMRSQTLQFIDLNTNQPSHTTIFEWTVRSDDRHCYLLARWSDDDHDNVWQTEGVTRIDQMRIDFDDGSDGILGSADDRRYVVPAWNGTLYRDSNHTDIDDAIGDGKGWIRYHNGTYIAEFLIPRDDDSNGNDAQLQHQIPFNIVLLDRLVLDANDNSLIAGHLASLAPSIETPALWPQLPIHAHNTTHLQQPTDLGGLIAYISKTNNSLGDIFLFDPDTRVKTKITPTSAADLALFNSLKKDAISLSNDHSRVAFHAYPGTGTILDAEIYVLNHITGALTQLTNNGHIDGHPAWSPDDTTIAFASYNPAHGDGGSHIYTIASNGSGTVSDITALHNPYVGNVLYRVEENDPEYLRDGRLLIKTNRWTPWQRDGGGPYQHELAIASINSDGSQLTQLSFPNGTIDHDPIANGQYIVWERLMVDIDYSATVQSFYEPWHLLRTPIAGGPVSTILADDWVNWLPVPQPDGNYIAYFKQSGYNECRLLDPSGNDLGRFIPDETQLGYMDWKADPIPAAATQ